MATYTVYGARILKDGSPVYFRGVNAMQVFGLTSQTNLTNWEVELVRECIDIENQPITGSSSVNVGGTYYHSMQKIVDANRANGRVTLLCPFWKAGEDILGVNPSSTSYYSSYKTKMQAIADNFKNQSDVWIEVWNEPYWYDGSNGYSESLWLSDMKDMVDNIRAKAPNNIIVVPGSHTGQRDAVILNKGAELLQGRSNIVFDVHAYEHWLYDNSPTVSSIEARIQSHLDAGLCVIFGEVAVRNSINGLAYSKLLDAARTKKVTVLGWLWKTSTTDANALLADSSGNPNNNNNSNWGGTFQTFLTENRDPISSGDGGTGGGTVSTQPQNVTITNIASTSATVSWDAVSGAQHYTCEYKLSTATTWSWKNNLTTTSVNLTGLESGKTYDVRVIPYITGWGTYSTVKQFTTEAATTTPDTPSGLAASNISATGATFSCNAVSQSGASYVFEYKKSSDSTYTAVSSTDNTEAVTGLTAGTTYDLRVKSVLNGVSSAYSSVIQFSTSAPPATLNGTLVLYSDGTYTYTAA